MTAAPQLTRAQARTLLILAPLAMPMFAFAQAPLASCCGSGAAPHAEGLEGLFEPELHAALDTRASWLESNTRDEGLLLELRSLELGAHSQLGQSAFARALLVVDEEDIVLEEALVHYDIGEHHTSLQAGRFFVDFGRQMRLHVHELATFERPAVLRAFLGEELAGTGLQFDQRFVPAQGTDLRFSIGVFDFLGAEHDHGAEEEAGEAQRTSEGRRELDELSITARVEGTHRLGRGSFVQWGSSWRGLPHFAYDLDAPGGQELFAERLENHVLGVDLGYGWHGDGDGRSLTFGGELLWDTGDIAAAANDNGTPANPADDTLEVLDGDRSGFYLFGEYAWNRKTSAGLLYSEFESALDSADDSTELTAFVTHRLADHTRLRLGLSRAEGPEAGDETQVILQLTNYLGHHSHDH